MKNKRSVIIVVLLVAVVALTIWEWGKYHWKQEVMLHDGRTLWVDRTTVYRHYGELVQLSHPSPFADGFSFWHPNKWSHITWPLNENVRPLLLDFVGDIPYLVTEINGGKHYDMGCPPHPYAFYKYEDGDWQRIDVRALPQQLQRTNMLPYLDSVRREEIRRTGNWMDAKATKKALKPLPLETQAIDRRFVSPRFYCPGGTNLVGADGKFQKGPDGKPRLISVVDIYYGEGTARRLEEKFGTNASSLNKLTESEAIEMGLIKSKNPR